MVFRKGEVGKARYRMERLYWSNSQWFFATREGEEVGPFGTRDEARNCIEVFIRHTQRSLEDRKQVSAGLTA